MGKFETLFCDESIRFDRKKLMSSPQLYNLQSISSWSHLGTSVAPTKLQFLDRHRCTPKTKPKTKIQMDHGETNKEEEIRSKDPTRTGWRTTADAFGSSFSKSTTKIGLGSSVIVSDLQALYGSRHSMGKNSLPKEAEKETHGRKFNKRILEPHYLRYFGRLGG